MTGYRGEIYETGFLYQYQYDEYYIESGEGTIELELDVGDHTDLDLYLLDSSYNVVASSENIGFGLDAYISVHIEAGDYIIEVFCWEVDPDGWDYSYTLTGTYPDPSLPDLIISSITINQSPNQHDGIVYTPSWYPATVTVTVENIGQGNAEGSHVALLYDCIVTGTEEQLITSPSWVPPLNAGEFQDITFYDFNNFIQPNYQYHPPDDDPALIRLYAMADYYDDIEEENENNNYSDLTGQIYLIEEARYDNYGSCVGTHIHDLGSIAGTFGEPRDNSFHNAIDLVENAEESVYSISSGKVEFHDYGPNSYVIMRSYEDYDRRFVYLHIQNPQYDYPAGQEPYRNSGVYICDVRNMPGSHVHFVDRTGPGGSPKNPLRSDGIVRSQENADPHIFEIRLYPTSDTPNWNDNPIASTSFPENTINYSMHTDFEVVADAGDNLGIYHGGSSDYTLGIYSIGYRLKNSQNQVLINEPDRIVFDSIPSAYHYVYAIGTSYIPPNYYYIATNSNTSDAGSLDLSQYADGEYILEVIAKDIDGNMAIAELNFELTNSPNDATQEEILAVFSLGSNHPNPFNPSTTISYSLADNIKNPKIEIYNIKGQLVRALELPEEQGANTVNWDGRMTGENLLVDLLIG
jgi:hypothetical protein